MLGTSITSKGQVTIPSDIRRALGLKTGDRVTFVTDGDRAILLPVRGDFLSLKGVLKPYFKGRKPMSAVEMRETAKKYVVERYKDHRHGGK
jgi:AbrB family looped-hinge helix DNA binding protein